MENNLKQVIVLRKDLNMRKGKMVAQGAHASMKAIMDTAYKTVGLTVKHPAYNNRTMSLVGDYLSIPLTSDVKDWLEGIFTKICVSVDSEDELLTIFNRATEAKIICSLIRDSGKTEFNGIPTYTAVAVGPGASKDIDKITGHLKLL